MSQRQGGTAVANGSSREQGSGNRPVWEKRMGKITCSIWSHQGDDSRDWFSVTFSRLYKEDNSWKRSQSFGKIDLPLVARLASLAQDWIYAQSQSEESEEG